MKAKALIFFLFFALKVGAQCTTVTSISATSITYSSAQIGFTTPSVSLNFVIVYTDGVTTWRQNVNDPGAPYPHVVGSPLTGLDPATEYDYYIVRYCSPTDSVLSATNSFTTTAPTCDTVTNIVSTVTNSTATITATEAAYGSTYTIFYVKQGGTDTLEETGADADFSLSNLRNSTVYAFRIRTNCTTYSDSATTGYHYFTTSNSPNYVAMTGFGYQDKRGAIDSTLSIPTGPEASLRSGKNDKGALFYDTVSHSLMSFDPTTQEWSEVAATATQTLQQVTDVGNTTTENIKANLYRAATTSVGQSTFTNASFINFIGDQCNNYNTGFVETLSFLFEKPTVNEGLSGQYSAQIAERMTNSSYINDADNGFVIWVGRNDIQGNIRSNPNTIKASIARMVASLGSNTKYVILAVHNGVESPIGTAAYDSTIDLNYYLRTQYPGHFLDTRTHLVNSGNAAIAGDVYSLALGIPAWTTRTPDSTHPNKLGSWLIAKMIQDSLPTIFDGADRIICFGDSFTQGSGKQDFTGGYTVTSYPRFLTSTELVDAFNYNASTRSQYLHVFFNFGRQDLINGSTDTATISANMEAIIDQLDSSKYLVLGIMNGDTTSEQTGTPMYDLIRAYDSTLAIRYGNKYFNMRGYINGLIPAAGDRPDATFMTSPFQFNDRGYDSIDSKIRSILFRIKGNNNLIVSVADNPNQLSAPIALGNHTRRYGYFSHAEIGSIGTMDSGFPLNIDDKNNAIAFDNQQALAVPSTLRGTIVVGDARSFEGTGGVYGSHNTIVGIRAAFSMTKAFQNVVIGTWAFTHDTTGINNVVIGEHAADTTYNVSGLTAIGAFSAQHAQRAMVAIGAYSAPNALTSGGVHIGDSVAYNLIGGVQNVNVGNEAAYYNHDGLQNVNVGEEAGYGRTTGNDYSGAVHIGFRSGYAEQGQNNTLIGNTTGDSLNAGSNYNVFLGYRSGRNARSVSDGVILGSRLSYPIYNANGYTTIQNGLYIYNGATTPSDSTVNDNARIGIGVITPNTTAKLDITSTDKGVLFPRMTTTQQSAVGSGFPADGLFIYNTDSAAYMGAVSNVWGKIVNVNNTNYYGAGKKQTFQSNSTTAGLGFGGVTSDPSVLVNGDLWHNTTSNTLKYRANGTTRTLVNTDEAQTITNKDLSSATNTFPAWTTTTDYATSIYEALGSAMLTQSFELEAITTNTALASGTMRFVPVWLPVAATVTGVKWFQVTQGNYTGDSYNGWGLYSYSGGTLTLVASSTNDATIWSTPTSNSWGTKAFSATYSAAAGLYFLGYLYHSSAQTTAPAIGARAGFTSGNVTTFDFTNSAKIYPALTGQTALPTPQAMSGLSAGGVSPYVALY